MAPKLAQLKFLICLVMPLIVLGCDSVEDAILDCIDGDRPQFTNNTLPDGTLNQTYDATIHASIRNEPLDDSYYYYFRIDGALPPGIDTYQQDLSQTLNLEGTPTEAGIYTFNVNVTVYDSDNPNGISYEQSNSFDDGDNLCENFHNQSFTLTVNES